MKTWIVQAIVSFVLGAIGTTIYLWAYRKWIEPRLNSVTEKQNTKTK